MILVDSCVLVDWLADRATPATRRLEDAFQEELICLAPVVVLEVLRGVRRDADFVRTRDALLAFPCVPLDAEGHAAAAGLYRLLRARGVTVTSTVDCIIAQTCIASGLELLSSDTYFAPIAAHTPLRLCTMR